MVTDEVGVPNDVLHMLLRTHNKCFFINKSEHLVKTKNSY